MADVELIERLKRLPLYERCASWGRHVVGSYRQGQEEQLKRWERLLGGGAQFIFLVVRELARDNAIGKASSLAFFSVLSIVPFLSVATALLGAFGMFNPRQSELALYLQQLFPAVSAEIVVYLQELSSKGASTLGGVGGVMLLVISIFLFNNIEQTLTQIWQGGHNRPLIYKFLMFYTMVTLGPVMLMLSIVQTASAQVFVSARLGIDTGFFSSLLPFVYALLVFMLMNKILPNALVKWKAAFVGGAVTAGSFELAKWGFNQYVNLLLADSYNQLYGALGLAPIFMLWVYVTWFVILIGSEIAYCAQNFKHMIRGQMNIDDLLKGHRQETPLYDPLICLEVLSPVVNAFAAGDGGISEAELVHVTGLSGGFVRQVVEALIKHKVLIGAGSAKGKRQQVMPARPLEDIALADVVLLFQDGRVSQAGQEVYALKAEFLLQLERLLDGKSARSLLDERAVQALKATLAKPVVAQDEAVELELGSS